MPQRGLETFFFLISISVSVVVAVCRSSFPLCSLSPSHTFPRSPTTFCRPSLVAAAETTATETSKSAATAPPSPSSSSSSSSPTSSSSSSSERFEAADFSLSVPAGFGLAEVAKAGYTPTTAEERGARGRGIAAPDSPVKVRFTAPAAEGAGGGSGGSSGASGAGAGVGSSELSVIVRDAAGIKPTFLMVSDISQWGDAAAVGAVLLPRGVTVTRASTESVELPARDTGSIAGVVASPPQTAYLYEFEDQRGDLFVTLAAVARAGKIYVVAGSARGRAAWEARREGMREAVRSFRVTPTLR